MIIEPFKMKVNPEQSEKVQKILFANGYKWKNGAQRVLSTNYSFLYFNDGRELAHQINDAAYFVDNHLKEISFDEFMLKYTGVINVRISGSDLCGLFSRKNIPEKWFVKVTPKNYNALNSWLLMQENFNNNYLLEEYSGGNVGNVNYDGSYQDWADDAHTFKKFGHKEITFEQFEKYVLKDDVDGYYSTLREILIKSDMKKQYVIVTNSGASFDTHTDAGKYGCINYHYWRRLPHAKNGDKLEIVKEIMVNGYYPSYILKDDFGIEYIIKKSGVKLIDETMKKEIIGYKLKENCVQFAEAAKSISKQSEYDTKMEDNLKTYGWCFKSGSIACNMLTNAGVLDLWFEPVYKEIEPEIEISGYKAEFNLQNKTVKFGCKTISLEQLKAVLTVMDLNKQFDDTFHISEVAISPVEGDEFEMVKCGMILTLIQTLEK